ncbi:hypothetical protein C8Q76DRAFT_843912 [Earliella scabrosa]|nr:hypothetical protein C8Q76DRAFT_843912 [Earliella scabrosa]
MTGRMTIPDSLMKMFLFVLRECGVKDAPSFYSLRKIQKHIREMCGVPTIPCRSPQGNVFWMVDIRTLIAKDWSSPSVRPHIQLYPEVLEDGSMSEVWHGDKWHKGVDPSSLSPMYDASGVHYYVNEVCLLRNGKYIVPWRWVVFRGQVHADAYDVIHATNGTAIIDHTNSRLVPVSELQSNYFDLEAAEKIPKWALAESYVMPNPLRKIAGDEPLYTSFVNHFADDVSGNRSKSWNKHYNAYATHASLPRRFLQQEAHVHFVSTSPHASATEQFGDFKRTVESTHTNPIRVVDALTGTAVRIRIFVNAEPSDNPMQSEISGHIGGNGNKFCRKCEAGGTTAYKETGDGFHSLFKATYHQPGSPRTKDAILTELKLQVREACSGVEKRVKERQTLTGVKDAYTQYWIDELIKRARQAKAEQPERSQASIQEELVNWAEEHLGDICNPFLTLRELDPTQDTPVELLHTVLLGVVKYAWHGSHTKWNATQKTTYTLRLQATDTHALSVHAIRANYIMQYANSLIGRQLKTVGQASAFHVYDLVAPLEFKLWLAIGDMMALLWFPVIKNRQQYRHDLTVAIANVLDLFTEIEPSKILEKIKLHILVHAPDDVERFGPLIGMITELFESFNGVFRNASIQSNHQAPSRDIAQQLADQESLKHRMMGGYWSDGKGGWLRAGPRVRGFLQENPMVQRLIGWEGDTQPVPGSHKLAPIPPKAKQHPTVRLSQTLAHQALNCASYDLSLDWLQARHVISQAGDICVVGSWICLISNRPPRGQPGVVTMGRIQDIVAHPTQAFSLIILDIFEVASTRHPTFCMPYLIRRHGEPSYVLVKSTEIQFAFNVQHDCQFAKCAASGVRNVRQERVDSTVTEAYIEHKLDVPRFLINMHSLHNPHLIRSVLPHALVAPIPISADRRGLHDTMSARLRKTREQKEATAQARKAKKAADAQAASRSQPSRAKSPVSISVRVYTRCS